MPKRSKNHDIEDASRRQFDVLLPDNWVSRAKPSDYGVDVEVELFEDDGSATGLIFYVQLRGTDDQTKSRSATLELDQLGYFYSLDLATIFVRYCRPSNTFFWRWHYSITPSPKQQN